MVRPYPLYRLSTMASLTVSTCNRGAKKLGIPLSPLKSGVRMKLKMPFVSRTLGALWR